MHVSHTVARFVDEELQILRAVKRYELGMLTETDLTLYIVTLIARERDADNRRQLARYLKPVKPA